MSAVPAATVQQHLRQTVCRIRHWEVNDMAGRSKEETGDITLLGNQNTKYASDYAPEVLETFPNKHPDRDYFVKFNCPEFTSLCPITGQPDFSAIFRLPSLNGRSSVISSFVFLVPSGKIQMEIPFFTFSIP